MDDVTNFYLTYFSHMTACCNVYFEFEIKSVYFTFFTFVYVFLVL